jgi:hypothetical protein
MSLFVKKSYGRIFVRSTDEIERVSQIIKQLDEFEWGYLPDHFIAVWPGKIEVTYGHKFEIDIDQLTEACWNAGIHVFCVTGKRDPLAHL